MIHKEINKGGNIMFQVNLADTQNRKVLQKVGAFSVYEYERDLSVDPMSAMHSYYAYEMNIRKRQVCIQLQDSSCVLQSGAMQWMAGNVSAATNIKGAGDFFKKLAGSKVTGESAIKPKYQGTGQIVLEPTFHHLLIEKVDDWNGLVIEDGLFLACDGTVQTKVVARSSFSSAVAGGEGLFNNCLTGSGYVVLESRVPREELLEVTLQDDELKIDGNYAIAWSNSLKFTVERSTKSLIGSAASGEGLVSVYRGTGKVLMAPL